MLGKRPGATIALAALLIALLLSACGDDSGTAAETTAAATTNADAGETAPASGAKPNAWNSVNEQLRADILSYGDKGSEAQVEAAAAVVSEYLTVRSDEDFAAACSYMSPRLVEMMGGGTKGGCVGGVKRLSALSSLDEVEKAGEIDPTSVRISRNGKRAFLIYDDAYGDVYAMLMRPEGNIWNIHGFEATRLF